MKRWLVAIALLASQGCGLFATRADPGHQAQERAAGVREKMANLVYDRAVEDVWPLAHEVLSEHGYNGIDVTPGLEYESEWREDVAPSRFAGRLTQYKAQAIRLPHDQCRVIFTRYVRAKDRSLLAGETLEGTRDFELELLLYKKVDPDAADALERGATAPSSSR